MAQVKVRLHKIRLQEKPGVKVNPEGHLVVEIKNNTSIQELFEMLELSNAGKVVFVNQKAIRDFNVQLQDSDCLEIHQLIAGG